uniref:Uncharacterized protein n=1 Tax=Anguilla anguilla TaxID=7936 RepID=A0A0E9PD40_ANGAN
MRLMGLKVSIRSSRSKALLSALGNSLLQGILGFCGRDCR